MMSVLKIILILIALVPAGAIMMRAAADIRRDIVLHKRRQRAASTPAKNRLRVIK